MLAAAKAGRTAPMAVLVTVEMAAAMTEVATGMVPTVAKWVGTVPTQ